MRSLGAVVVGIGRYRLDQATYPPLRYASNDADRVARYLATCWPEDAATVIRVEEDQATLPEIAAAFVKLADSGPIELLFIFLSGHGLASKDRAGFVVQPLPGAVEAGLLPPEELDHLLGTVPASRVILILDCCYAEGIVRRMKFFSQLGDSEARLWVASSRESQRTWEEETIEHGIFTAHLLDLLNTGSSVKLSGIRDRLDVDGELFPILCDQVPLYVLEYKQEKQEPVKGGISMHAVSLPVARNARRIRERTALGTAFLRLRQMLVAGCAVTGVLLAFAYVFVYHAEVDRSGHVQLRHGTKWLSPVFGATPAIVDTGITTSDLSQDSVSRYPLQSGNLVGLWTQVDKQGYRSWHSRLAPSLSDNAIQTQQVLLGSREPSPVRRLSLESRPVEISFAAWSLLDSGDQAELRMLLPHILGADRKERAEDPFNPREMDFNVIDRSQEDLGHFASALKHVAAVDPSASFKAYLGFLKACAIWLQHGSPERHGREAKRRVLEDVADVLATIAMAERDRGDVVGLDQGQLAALKSLERTGYASVVSAALNGLRASDESRHAAATAAVDVFQGNSADPVQEMALRKLKGLLDGSEYSKNIVAIVHQRFVSAGSPEHADLTGFLIVAASRHALPSSVMELLIGRADEAVARKDDEFMDSEYARILAHAMADVPPGTRPRVFRLIEKVARTRPATSGTLAEIYGTLAMQGLETPAMFNHLIVQVREAKPYRSNRRDTVETPLPGMAIVVGRGPWISALAAVGTVRQLPAEAILALESEAEDPALREAIVRALGHQSSSAQDNCWEASCARLLTPYVLSSAKRMLVADVLGERLAGLSRHEFIAAIARLAMERDVEQEPEIRVALGAVRISAQLARLRTPKVVNSMYE